MTSPLGRVVEIAEEGRFLSKERGFLVVSAGRPSVPMKMRHATPGSLALRV
jgi:hypothetical protein